MWRSVKIMSNEEGLGSARIKSIANWPLSAVSISIEGSAYMMSYSMTKML